VDITAGDYFLGIYNKKKLVPILILFLSGYGVLF